MKNGGSGSWGIGAVIGAGLLYVLFRNLFPALGKILLWAAVLGGVLIAAIVAAAIYFAFAKPKTQGNKAASELAAGRSVLLDIRRIGMKIRHADIRGRSEEICGQVEKIFQTLHRQPEDIARMRQLFGYYLPTWRKILQKYADLEQGGMADGQMTDSVLECLGSIRTAMDKLYRNLFEEEILDLTVEMEVLTMVGKKDGLLEEGTLQVQEGI